MNWFCRACDPKLNRQEDTPKPEAQAQHHKAHTRPSPELQLSVQFWHGQTPLKISLRLLRGLDCKEENVDEPLQTSVDWLPFGDGSHG